MLYFQVNVIVVQEVSGSETQPGTSINGILQQPLWKKNFLRFTLVSRTNYKHVMFTSICKGIF